ncbi:MAG: class I SAM-dependent methyltransferase [Gallionellaceae bacterium]
MDWRLQIIKKTLLGRIPFGNSLRQLKRRIFGYKPDPDNLVNTVENLKQMQFELNSIERSFRKSTVLEIGSGWFPAIPLMLAMEDINHLYMTDLTPHMDEVTFKATLEFLRRQFPDAIPKRISRIDDIPASYLAPFDPDQLPDKSIDYIISRTVLEHIPPKEIIDFFSILRPKLAPDGLMVHLIDNSDHLEFNDKSITRINFLTWSKRKHALINFLMQDGENRLRHHEYPSLFKKAGFSVRSEKAIIHDATNEIAKTLELSLPYSEMAPEQLSVLTSIFILTPDTP